MKLEKENLFKNREPIVFQPEKVIQKQRKKENLPSNKDDRFPEKTAAISEKKSRPY